LERLLLFLQPCKLKAFPQKDSPFLCCTSKYFQKLKNKFFHTWKTYNTLKKSLSHLPLTWKDYYFLYNLANSKPLLKRILPFYVIQVKPLITSCSNTMSFLLLGVGP
jgi:hypothetical protein